LIKCESINLILDTPIFIRMYSNALSLEICTEAY